MTDLSGRAEASPILNPLLADGVGTQAAAMAAPADPEAVLEAFKETHETMMAEDEEETSPEHAPV